MSDWKITVGIRKPEKEPTSIDEMRVAIDRAGRDSSLICNALDVARYRGMSGEDTYVQLAYHALRMLESQYQLNLQFVAATPSPFKVIAPIPPHGHNLGQCDFCDNWNKQ